MSKKVKPFSALSTDELKEAVIILCSEKSVRCKHLPRFREIARSNTRVFIAMPQWELAKGSRGLAKAQILVSIDGVSGVISCSKANLNQLVAGDFGSVKQLGEIFFQDQKFLFEGESLDKKIKIRQVSNPVDQKFMGQAQKLVTESDCWWRPTACLFVKKSVVLISATSRNPWGTDCQCLSIRPEKIKLALGEQIAFCNAIHAEKAGIAKAAKKGISLNRSHLYITCCPCEECAKVIVEAGIKKVIFEGEYYDRMGVYLLIRQGVKVIKLSEK